MLDEVRHFGGQRQLDGVGVGHDARQQGSRIILVVEGQVLSQQRREVLLPDAVGLPQARQLPAAHLHRPSDASADAQVDEPG